MLLFDQCGAPSCGQRRLLQVQSQSYNRPHLHSLEFDLPPLASPGRLDDEMSPVYPQAALRFLLFRLCVHVFRADVDLGRHGERVPIRVTHTLLVARHKYRPVLLDR